MKPIFFLKGRTALYFGLKYLNFNKGDKILLPSFVCDAVTDQLKKMKIFPVFYKIDKNFDPIWRDINKKFSSDVKGIMMINFFGRPQNSNKFKIFCKKKKIFLIEDNCHSFNDIKSIKFSGDIMIMSPYKVIDQINRGGVLFVKKQKKKFSLKFVNIKKYEETIFNIILTYVKKLKILRFTHRFFFNRPNYESISVTKPDKIYEKKFLDENIIEKIKKFSFKKERNLRLKRFDVWKNSLKKFHLSPYFDYTLKDNYILWYLVVKINNQKIRKKIYDWGWKNDVDIISWPSFSKDFGKRNKVFKFSRKFILFPLNKDFKKNVEKFRY